MGNEESASLLESLLNFGLNDYAAGLISVGRLFKQYRFMKPDSPAQKWAESILTTHMRLCKASKNTVWQNEHNVFVARYIEGKTMPQIAREKHLTTRAAYYQFDHATERILVLMYGVNGIRQRPQEAVATGSDEEQAERE